MYYRGHTLEVGPLHISMFLLYTVSNIYSNKYICQVIQIKDIEIIMSILVSSVILTQTKIHDDNVSTALSICHCYNVVVTLSCSTALSICHCCNVVVTMSHEYPLFDLKLTFLGKKTVHR